MPLVSVPFTHHASLPQRACKLCFYWTCRKMQCPCEAKQGWSATLMERSVAPETARWASMGLQSTVHTCTRQQQDMS